MFLFSTKLLQKESLLIECPCGMGYEINNLFYYVKYVHMNIDHIWSLNGHQTSHGYMLCTKFVCIILIRSVFPIAEIISVNVSFLCTTSIIINSKLMRTNCSNIGCRTLQTGMTMFLFEMKRDAYISR